MKLIVPTSLSQAKGIWTLTGRNFACDGGKSPFPRLFSAWIVTLSGPGVFQKRYGLKNDLLRKAKDMGQRFGFSGSTFPVSEHVEACKSLEIRRGNADWFWSKKDRGAPAQRLAGKTALRKGGTGNMDAKSDMFGTVGNQLIKINTAASAIERQGWGGNR